MKILIWMLIGIIINAVIIETIEYHSQKMYMDCIWNNIKTMKFKTAPYCSKKYIQGGPASYYPDRPYLSECLFNQNRKACQTYGIEGWIPPNDN